MTRKSIARILTVINQETLHQVRKSYAGNKAGRPRDLRQKKTKAIRLALKPSEKNAKTRRALRKIRHNPPRKYAIKV